jgi:hypothetical protein
MLWPTVSRPVSLTVKPHLGPKTRTAVLSMRDSLSDERAGLLFTAIKNSSTCYLYIFTILYVGILNSHLSKSPVPCRHLMFTVLHVTLVCVCVCVCVCVYIYIQYIRTRPLWVQAWHIRSYPDSCSSCCNGFLVTWTFVRLTVAKLKPLIRCREHLRFVRFCVTFASCLHKFVT